MDPRPSRPPSGRERREAASELRERRDSTGRYAILIGLLAIVAVPLAVSRYGAAWAWLGGGLALALLVSAFGVWRAAEWARISAGALLVTAAIATGVFEATGSTTAGTRELAPALGMVVVFGPGMWLLLPRTRDEFRRMRESTRAARRTAP